MEVWIFCELIPSEGEEKLLQTSEEEKCSVRSQPLINSQIVSTGLYSQEKHLPARGGFIHTQISANLQEICQFGVHWERPAMFWWALNPRLTDRHRSPLRGKNKIASVLSKYQVKKRWHRTHFCLKCLFMHTPCLHYF